MAYYLSAFDGVNIPIKAGDQDINTDDSVNGFIKVAGGGRYYLFGTDRAPGVTGKILCRARVTGATMHAILDSLDPLRAKRGVRGTLTATMGDATSRTRTAVLTSVPGKRKSTDKHVDCTLEFEALTLGWKGAAHNDTTTLNTSPKTVGVANNGNIRVTDAVITITVPGGGTPMTGLNIYVANVSYISYGGTVAAGTSLVIDCGARTVVNNGTADRANLTYNATEHKISDWLRLEAGSNSVVVSHTDAGTNSTVNFAYNDLWE